MTVAEHEAEVAQITARKRELDAEIARLREEREAIDSGWGGTLRTAVNALNAARRVESDRRLPLVRTMRGNVVVEYAVISVTAVQIQGRIPGTLTPLKWTLDGAPKGYEPHGRILDCDAPAYAAALKQLAKDGVTP